MSGTAIPKAIRVLHVGVVGDLPGGMAQVVAGYLSWPYENCVVSALRSTRGKRDPLAPVLWLLAAVRLVAARFTQGRIVTIFHLSQGGSFVREGSLAWLSKMLGMAVGIHIHGSSFTDFADNNSRLVRTSLRSAQTVFTLTDATTKSVRERVSSRCRVIKVPNAVAVPDDQPMKETIVLFAGEVGHRKGADVLLAAWRELAPQHDEWQLIVAGPAVIQLSDYEDVQNVLFPGSLPHAEVAELQARAAIAVLPSRNEALPMFLLESMARSCAVVATDVGSVAELLEGAGLVVDPGSSSQLVAAFRKLIEDESLRADMSARSLRKIQQGFSAERCASTLEHEWMRMNMTLRTTRGAV